ncbi:TOBE domain-containing protein, partial [Burkholderia multivorans]
LGDGTRLVGRRIGDVAEGAAAVACIRPERMSLAARGANGQAPDRVNGDANGHANGAAANRLTGEARSLIYFGDHVRVRCALPGQDECFVKMPLGTGALDAFSPGAPVSLAFAPEHLRVFA